MIKVIAFDVFGTVFDMSSASREEIKAYITHIRKPEWSPLRLPESWEHFPAHADSAQGIARLRKKFIVVTCSNGPIGLLTKLSKNNGISWDAIVPLEIGRVFKTNPQAYLTVSGAMNIEPSEMMMVTANKDFGDLEASSALGMRPQLIRHKDGLSNIISLAKNLGC